MNSEQVISVAKGVSDFGLLAMSAAFYLILSASMMVAIFRWFKSIMNHMMTNNRISTEMLDALQENNAAIKSLAERMSPETLLRIRNLSGIAFDLSVEQVCRLIKRVREENHIKDRSATEEKIRLALQVLHNDRNSRFFYFTWRGKPLSAFCPASWVEDVAQVVESEIYHVDGANNARAYTNVKLAYDNIKIDFFKRLNE